MMSFSSPRGIRDILSPSSKRRRRLLNTFAQQADLADFQEVVLPLFEEAGVFMRVGESTEIVQKQMYEFTDKDDRLMVLRPESTAGVMRAYIQNRPKVPWKVWYEGAHFRYERPQAGRLRQFHQVGVEILGTEDPMADVETAALGWSFLDGAGARVKLLVNSLGNEKSRSDYSAELKKYLEGREGSLSSQVRQTLKLNPLRVLDSKREEDAEAIAGAPLLEEHLSDGDKAHFGDFCEGLDALKVPYEKAPRLVRGLDYYTRTAYEYVSEDIEAAHSALGGGGRYDGLSEDLGGPACPGVGFAIGIDRMMTALEKKEKKEKKGGEDKGEDSSQREASPDVFLVDVIDGKDALKTADELQKAGVATARAYDGRSMKAQMKLADRSGAPLAVIIGEDEKSKDSVLLAELRGAEKSDQEMVARDKLTEEIKKRLDKLQAEGK